MRAWRVHHPGAGEATELTLDAAESHHLARVLRARAGDAIRVFDGAGREWEAVVVGASRSAATIRRGNECLDPVEPVAAVTLFQGLCRADRFEWVVQKATELGAASIVPVVTERAEAVRVDGARLDRWRRIALEAAKQSGRRRLPRLSAPCVLSEVVGPPGLVLDPEAARSLGDAVAEATGGVPSVLVGPEGGLDGDEVAGLADRGWIPAALGPRTLRTETAGVVALALVLHLHGDLGRRAGPS